MARKCSHCGHNGHNSRTCISSKGSCLVSNSSGGFKLFGVQLQMVSPVKKSFSMECLSYAYQYASSSSSPTSSTSSLVAIEEAAEKISTGYLSDGLIGRAQERKKGVPWTEEEHRQFLAGLEKLGKGDWRGISRNFVTTRTPTQVASHAQKYFLRQNSLEKKKRRSSLFDVVSNPEATNLGTEPSNSEGNCFARDQFNPRAAEKPELNLSFSIEAQNTTQLPSYLPLLPDSSESGVPPSSFLVQMPHVQLSPLDLELSISLAKREDDQKSSSKAIFLETIKVT